MTHDPSPYVNYYRAVVRELLRCKGYQPEGDYPWRELLQASQDCDRILHLGRSYLQAACKANDPPAVTAQYLWECDVDGLLEV